MNEIETLLRSLVNRPKFTSINLTWNDDHSPNYKEADGYYEYDSSEWVGQDEYLKAMIENSVWTLHWYPDTPVGFCRIRASSIQAIVDWIKNHENKSSG